MENSYYYNKEIPQYTPTEFSIINGAPNNNDIVDVLGKRIGIYYGNGEYSVNENDLNNINVESNNIYVTGAHENNTASTVEPDLYNIFNQNTTEYQTINNALNITPPAYNNIHTDMVKFSDIPDEILYGEDYNIIDGGTTNPNILYDDIDINGGNDINTDTIIGAGNNILYDDIDINGGNDININTINSAGNNILYDDIDINGGNDINTNTINSAGINITHNILYDDIDINNIDNIIGGCPDITYGNINIL